MVTAPSRPANKQHTSCWTGIGKMHRSYQPLKPVTNRYLQQRWDQNNYQNHCRKVWGQMGGTGGRGGGMFPAFKLNL